jgi:hypothetical protein
MVSLQHRHCHFGKPLRESVAQKCEQPVINAAAIVTAEISIPFAPLLAQSCERGLATI